MKNDTSAFSSQQGGIVTCGSDVDHTFMLRLLSATRSGWMPVQTPGEEHADAAGPAGNKKWDPTAGPERGTNL